MNNTSHKEGNTMKAEHEAKIHELVNTLASSIKIKAMALGSSGGIDEDDYSVDEYVLAKILVTAAVEDLKDVYMPFGSADRKTVKNLKHF